MSGMDFGDDDLLAIVPGLELFGLAAVASNEVDDDLAERLPPVLNGEARFRR